MKSTSANRRGFLGGLAAMPALSLPAFADPPKSDLARACLWAVDHRTWIDETSQRENWNDERLDKEIDRVDAVFTRAINEPSADLREVAAKASLALEDYERFTAQSDSNLDDGERIVLTVLREIIALGAVS